MKSYRNYWLFLAARGLDVKKLPYMINVTLPDEKSNYVHRIGRVGRAERMGLAISLVAQYPEKVWFHGEWCKSRGRNCNNSRLTDQGGCAIYYNEPQYLADIEEHLGVTIQQINPDMKVEANEFDGKVTYGQKRKAAGKEEIRFIKTNYPMSFFQELVMRAMQVN